MIQIFAIFLAMLIGSPLYSQQREVFDLVSYTSLSGWQKETNNTTVSYVIANNKTGDWCRISIFESIVSSGNLANDFDHEWNEFVTKAFENTVKPVPTLLEKEGWTIQSGSANYTWQNRASIIQLLVISGNGRTASITINTNSKAYQAEADRFLDSIKLLKSEKSPSTTYPIPNPPNSLKSGATGITKSTTTFNDGWVAKSMEDYVLVTKENIRLYLHYGFPIEPSQRNLDETAQTQANWNKFIVPRYNINNFLLNPDVGSFGGSFNYYAEGTGTEKSTSKAMFIGFRTMKDGTNFCVEAVAPNKEAYLRHFPTLQMLNDMRRSNRFAITEQDIIGAWSSFSGSTLQYYNVYTGQDAGMQFSQGGQTFTFLGTSSYQANISGALGNMGGTQKAFDNTYKGKFTVTDWEITLTNYSGSTQVFTAYFEAVKGGRILHIAKKDAPGVRYALVKVE